MNEIIHILNGDSLNEVFPDSISGDRIIFREMMMEGPTAGQDIHSLLSVRKQYFLEAYSITGEEYEALTSSEFLKVLRISGKEKVYLWFEYDLFCQVNMWCALNMLTTWNNISNIYLVYPGHNDWKGFSVSDQALLLNQYHKAIKLTTDDINHIQQLWTVYTMMDWKGMASMADYSSEALPRQTEIIRAQLDRKSHDNQSGIIHSTIKDLILKYGKEDFGNIFRSFSDKMGRYGMGDLQVKRLVDMY